MSTTEGTLDLAPPPTDAPARVDEAGVELKRGAFLNTIAMLASNFRGIFTFLVARMLGPAALGIFSVAWSTTDILSKIGVLGLDNAIITVIARSGNAHRPSTGACGLARIRRAGTRCGRGGFHLPAGNLQITGRERKLAGRSEERRRANHCQATQWTNRDSGPSLYAFEYAVR